ncbi:MAG: DNA cytosine methyltransferase [Phycisphaerae bacterium]
MRRATRPTAIDLFCGVGGMSLGFEQAGFDVVAAFDSDDRNVRAYARNFPHASTHRVDLRKTSGDELREMAGLGKCTVDVLIGGPPCQGFSLMGKRDPQDPRSSLLYDFARLVRQIEPRYFVMENVAGLMSGTARAFLDSFLRRVKRAGYDVVEPVATLDAFDFGVPQRRKRVFVLGAKRGEEHPEYPKRNGDAESCPTVWDAIGDLPNVDDFPELLETDVFEGPLGGPSRYAAILRGERKNGRHRSRPPAGKQVGLSGCARTRHQAKTVKRFANTKPGTTEPVSRFYRLPKDGVSTALRAGTGPDRGSFMAPRPIHPMHPRCITVREGARLHSFPDWMQFDATKWRGFRQVGNAVPATLACSVASRTFLASTK